MVLFNREDICVIIKLRIVYYVRQESGWLQGGEALGPDMRVPGCRAGQESGWLQGGEAAGPDRRVASSREARL